MAEQDSILIVGAGHGAGQAVTSLRSGGFEGNLTVVGDEEYIPYQRPPLSKAYLAGELEIERLYVKPPGYYDDKNVTLLLGKRVVSIDRSARRATLEDGTELGYGKLLLITGSRVRQLSIPGAELPGIHYLRTISDVDGIRRQFADAKKMVVVGGGYIGLEVAAVSRKHGLDVTVLEAESRLMSRVVGPEISTFFADLHSQAGVNTKTATQVAGFEGSDKLTAVKCADGTIVDADLAVVGVGILPNQELAADAGLKVENGIVVDDCCRTEDPCIFAAGDCTNHPNDLLGRRVRLESVHNALEQAKTAAAAMLGNPKPYHQVPWFWSDQYDIKLQIAGLSAGYDEIVLRGDPAAKKFAAFYLKGGEVIAVDAINSPPEYMVGRKLIAQHARIEPQRLADTSIPMKEII